MSKNETATYWLEEKHEVTEKLAEKTERTVQDVAADLAYIAGDHADMSDRDVIVTFYSEHDLPHEGHMPRFGGGWYCDTCDSPYCELA